MPRLVSNIVNKVCVIVENEYDIFVRIGTDGIWEVARGRMLRARVPTYKIG